MERTVSLTLWLLLEFSHGRHWRENGEQKKSRDKVFSPLVSCLLVGSSYVPLTKTIRSVRQPSLTDLF